MTPWTVARQAPLSMGFSRQEYWSGLPFPSPGALPDPGIEPGSLTLQAESSPSEPPGKLDVDKMGPAFRIKGAIACSMLYSTPAQGWPGAGLRNAGRRLHRQQLWAAQFPLLTYKMSPASRSLKKPTVSLHFDIHPSPVFPEFISFHE